MERLFNYVSNTDYSKEIKLFDSNKKIKCYSKKDMKAKFPAGGYKVCAQIGKNKGDTCGFFICDSNKMQVYPAVSSRLIRVVGYVEVEDNQYIAITKSNILPILLYLLLAVAIVLAIIFGVSRCSKQPSNQAAQNAQVDQNVVLPDELTTVEHIDTQGKNIQVPGVPQLNFVANKKEQTHVFSNPADNPCYFKIQIIIDDSNKTIFQSELIPPGYSIQSVKLNEALKAGTYQATIKYLTYSFDKEMNALNNAVVKTQIVVK